jgi:hypothetical protein
MLELKHVRAMSKVHYTLNTVHVAGTVNGEYCCMAALYNPHTMLAMYLVIPLRMINYWPPSTGNWNACFLTLNLYKHDLQFCHS